MRQKNIDIANKWMERYSVKIIKIKGLWYIFTVNRNHQIYNPSDEHLPAICGMIAKKCQDIYRRLPDFDM